MYVPKTLTAALLTAAFATPALAHGGRRFEIQVDSQGQLYAQGVNTGSPDGAPDIRPYYNAIHGHWANSAAGNNAFADLPSFDVFSPPAELEGADLTITLANAFKWVAPPTMPDDSTVPVFEPLDSSETIYFSFGGTTLNTDDLGQSLVLLDPVPVGGQGHLDVSYEIAMHPDNAIYILELTLASSAADILDSDPVYAILSPQGSTYHHASLFTERYLGTPVPEPGSLAVLAVVGLAMRTRRRR
ncbi:MAG: PEP-CTERM sorting domain-containing protein [Phycisphaerales bacterium JB063]